MKTKTHIKEQSSKSYILEIIQTASKHPKCKGFKSPDYGWGSEYSCGYNTSIDCDMCKYGGGRKNPEAKCNQADKDLLI